MGYDRYFFGSPIWAFTWNPPFDKALRRLASGGCKGFELVAWSPEMLDYYTPATLAELRAIATGEGLTLTNFFFNLPFDYATGAPSSRADTETFRRACDVIAGIGAPIITSMTPYPFNSKSDLSCSAPPRRNGRPRSSRTGTGRPNTTPRLTASPPLPATPRRRVSGSPSNRIPIAG
jgi:sugar phosphate isomerase/epimerase